MKSLPKLRFTPIRHRWHTPDLVIVITSFQLFGPNILELCGNKYFDFLRTRSMVFHLNESCALYQTSIFFIANIVFYTFLTPLKEGVFRTMTDISFSTPPFFHSGSLHQSSARYIYTINVYQKKHTMFIGHLQYTLTSFLRSLTYLFQKVSFSCFALICTSAPHFASV